MKSSVMSQRPLRRAKVWLRQAQQENALYEPESASVYVMNDTALAIWELCDGETWPEEMIEAICQISGMHETIVAEDVERVLGDFATSGLIEWA